MSGGSASPGRPDDGFPDWSLIAVQIAAFLVVAVFLFRLATSTGPEAASIDMVEGRVRVLASPTILLLGVLVLVTVPLGVGYTLRSSGLHLGRPRRTIGFEVVGDQQGTMPADRPRGDAGPDRASEPVEPVIPEWWDPPSPAPDLERKLNTLEDEHKRLKERHRSTKAALRRAREQIPEVLWNYYRDGAGEEHGLASARRSATSEVDRWRALEDTHLIEPLAPLFELIDSIIESVEKDVHHVAVPQLLDRLVQVSSRLRDDPWLDRALVWAKRRYAKET